MSSAVEKLRGSALINASTCEVPRSWTGDPFSWDRRDLAGLPLISLAAAIRQPARIRWFYPADPAWSLHGAPLLRIVPFTGFKSPGLPTPSQGCGNSSDCCSVTSEEGSILPRIIKPRKRRKKERRLAYAQKNPKAADTDPKVTALDCGTELPDLFRLRLDSEPEEALPVPVLDSLDRNVEDDGSLEIYSEIIASPYGHRDIEIRITRNK